jgi:putative pyruvate formate lyase activating enzyme
VPKTVPKASVSPYAECRLCPRECGVDRTRGERGFCGETDELRLAVAGLHFGEEPPLTGTGGSGTIFVCGCAMGCPFCQNYRISRGGLGRIVGRNEFVAICEALQDEGAGNFNLVTPSHMAPTLAAYLSAVRDAGIDSPVAWNSSGYESTAAVGAVSPFVDVWLPDLKTLDAATASGLYGLPDYPEAAQAALAAMAGAGALETDGAGRLIRGLMVRHLVIPGELPSTRGVLEWFAENLAGKAWLSLMTQYTPVRVPGERRTVPSRQLNAGEYEVLLQWLEELGIDDGFVQDLEPGDDWLPDFDEPNPFGSDLSRIVWRWDSGFDV